MVQLVNNAPQIRPDGKRITGSKESSLVELDIFTGRVADEFQADTGCTGTGTNGFKGSEHTVALGHAGKESERLTLEMIIPLVLILDLILTPSSLLFLYVQ